MVFLRQDVNSPKNAKKGIIYAILREKNELTLRVFKSTFYVTWKRDFLQNVVKTNKKV